MTNTLKFLVISLTYYSTPPSADSIFNSYPSFSSLFSIIIPKNKLLKLTYTDFMSGKACYLMSVRPTYGKVHRSSCFGKALNALSPSSSVNQKTMFLMLLRSSSTWISFINARSNVLFSSFVASSNSKESQPSTHLQTT
ncbi:hypothetical protein D3C84_817140 [compost metagenome]